MIRCIIRHNIGRACLVMLAALLVLLVSCDSLLALKFQVAGSDIAVKGAWYDVRYRDATGDGATDDRTAINNAATDAAGGLLFFPARAGSATYRIGSNITLDETIWMGTGAVLRPDNGVTVTINGPILDTDAQIFDTSAGGDFAGTLAGIPIKPEWFGAVKDGATDDSPEIQEAVDLAATSGGGMVKLGEGTYRLDTTVNLLSGVSIEGQGASTVIDFPVGDYAFSAQGTKTATTSLISGVSVDDCELIWTATGAGVVCAVDNVLFQEGAGSARITEGGATPLNTLLAHHDFAAADISEFAEIILWVRSSIPLAAGDMQIVIDNTAACASPLESYDVPILVANTWTEVTYTIANPGNFTAIISVGVYQVVDVGAFIFHVDDIRAVGASEDQADITVVNAGAFSAADWIFVQSEELFDGGPIGTGTKHAEIRRIASIAGNIITLETKLAHYYRTADTGAIYLLTMLDNIGVRSLTVDGAGAAGTQRGVLFNYVYKADVENVTVSDFYRHNINIDSCVDFRVRDCNVWGADEGGLGYGVLITYASRSYLIDGLFGRYCRHIMAHGGTTSYGVQRDGLITNSWFEGGSPNQQAAIDFHHTSTEITVANNTFRGITVSAPSGTRLKFSGNEIHSDSEYALTLWTYANDIDIIDNTFCITGQVAIGGFGAVMDRVNIDGNTFICEDKRDGTSIGVYATYQGTDIRIANNVFSGFAYGVRWNATSATAVSTNIQIVGNEMKDITHGGVYFYATDEDVQDVLVSGNHISGTSGHGVYMGGTATELVDGVAINGNYISGVDTGIELASYTANWSVGSDNHFDGVTANMTLTGANLGAGTTPALDKFISVSDFIRQPDGTANNIVTEREFDTTANRAFDHSHSNADTQDMDWYAEVELSEFSYVGIILLTIHTRASDFANCAMQMTLEDQDGNVDATGAVVITPTGNGVWEEFTYTPTSAYVPAEHVMIRIAVISLDTGDTLDFSGVSMDL